MTNSQVSGSMMVGEPATFLTLSGRKLAVTFVIFFYKTAAAVLFSCPPGSSFYLHWCFIAYLSLPWSIG